MIGDKAIEGLLKADPQKRYRSFLDTVTDREEVWLLSSEEGEATVELDGVLHVLVWPRKEFCELMMSSDQPVPIEIHEFLEQCNSLDDSVRFMVFPTNENSYIVTAEQLCTDIQAHLDELE